MQPAMRDETAILKMVLQRAGLEATLDDEAGFPLARFECTFPAYPGTTKFLLDAPQGWLRVSTVLDAPDLDVASRANLGLVYLQTGLGHCHYDAERKIVRFAASLPAVNDAPIGTALLETLRHLAAVKHTTLTGQGDVRSVVDSTPLPNEPTLADVARSMGRSLALVEERGSFVGGLEEPTSGTTVAMRLHTAAPGVFAFDAWKLPPAKTPIEAALFERLDAFNATLSGGAMMLFPQAELLVYRWACPYRWLDVDELEAPAVAQTALDAFVRWAKGTIAAE